MFNKYTYLNAFEKIQGVFEEFLLFKHVISQRRHRSSEITENSYAFIYSIVIGHPKLVHTQLP